VIPEHLKSTWALLRAAYPDGIPDAEYFAVLENLYQHMSDRNLADVLAVFTGRDVAAVTNDVYAVGAGRQATPDVMATVRARLERVGFRGRSWGDTQVSRLRFQSSRAAALESDRESVLNASFTALGDRGERSCDVRRKLWRWRPRKLSE
jgi:hypothetical protein